MTMTTKNNENRTGIYVQESVGVTTAGDGLGPRGDKSPVAQNYDNTLNISHSQEVRSQEIYRRNSFYRSTSPSRLSEIVGGGSESDTNDESPHRHPGNRWQRNRQMKKEFLKLGFLNREIRVMKAALNDERKLRNKLSTRKLHDCEEKNNLDPETGGHHWRERTYRNRDQERYKDRSSPGSSGHFSRESNKLKSVGQSTKIIFTSPAILAGVRDQDYSSVEYIKRTAHKVRKMNRDKGNQFEEARRRMGLRGEHIMRRYSVDSLPNQDCPDNMEIQNLNSVQAKYPIEVAIINKSHPFGEIPDETRFLILDALETTVQDERSTGAHWIKISSGRYKNRCLHVNCKNIETVRFLESKVPLYNRLWREADLLVTTEKIKFKRSKYKVNFPNYHLTTDEFFKIIKKQNGFPTEHWTLYYKGRENDRFKAILGIDPVSARRLEESDGFVYFFFERIQFSDTKKNK